MTNHQSEVAAATTLAVGVVTYQRPERLERLLSSLAATSAPDTWAWTERSSSTTIRKGQPKPLSSDGPTNSRGWSTSANRIPVFRSPETEPSTSAESDWVAFIDDDEEASPQWLVELERTQTATKADAVVGNTTFAFEDPAPSWLDGAGVYDFTPDAANNADTTYVSTNNLLLRTSLVEQLGPLFDERFNKTGGEDHHLGHRLVRGNFKLVQSSKAMTTEWVPASRMTLDVVMSRLQRDGNTLAVVDLAFAETEAERRRIRLHHLVEGLAKLPLGLARALAFGVRGGTSGALRGLRTSVIRRRATPCGPRPGRTRVRRRCSGSALLGPHESPRRASTRRLDRVGPKRHVGYGSRGRPDPRIARHISWPGAGL